jgi:hypothetical protein
MDWLLKSNWREIIRAMKGARNDMIDLETLSDEQSAELHQKFSKIAIKARNGRIPLADAVEDEMEDRAEERASE